MITSNDIWLKAISLALFNSIWAVTLVACIFIILSRTVKISQQRLYQILLFGYALLIMCFGYDVYIQKQELTTNITNTQHSEDVYIKEGSEITLSESQKPHFVNQSNSLDLISIELPSSISFLIAGIWLVIVSVLLITLFIRLLLLYTLKKQSILQNTAWLKNLYEIQDKLDVKGKINLITTKKAKEAGSYDFFEKYILIPETIINKLNENEIKSILIHEVAHLKRKDFYSNIFLLIGKYLFFFNPIIWWMQKYADLLRENCCDNLVLNQNIKPIEYTETLLKLHDYRISNSFSMMQSFRGSKSNFYERTQFLLKGTLKKPNLNNLQTLLAVCFLSFFLVSFNTNIFEGEKALLNKGEESTNEPYSLYNVELNLRYGSLMSNSNKTYNYVINGAPIKEPSALPYYNRDIKIDSLIYLPNESLNKDKVGGNFYIYFDPKILN